MDLHYGSLLQALGAYARNVRNYRAAGELFNRLAQARRSTGDEEGEAAAFHQLRIIAEEQRDFQAAQEWYRKSLTISEKQGNEHGAAGTFWA
jgi:tetratricopeptide (TPR) repeat protein